MGHSTAQDDWLKMYQEHADSLYLFARRQLNGSGDAEDVLHDVFLSAWEQIQEGRDIQPSWLYSRIRFRSIDLVRRDKRRRKRESDFVEGHTEALFDASVAKQDDVMHLQAALALLPPEQEEVLIMKLWGGLTYEQIGEITQTSANTAASRYRYGLEALKKELEGILT